jgi:hypothetical protein
MDRAQAFIVLLDCDLVGVLPKIKLQPAQVAIGLGSGMIQFARLEPDAKTLLAGINRNIADQAILERSMLAIRANHLHISR